LGPSGGQRDEIDRLATASEIEHHTKDRSVRGDGVVHGLVVAVYVILALVAMIRGIARLFRSEITNAHAPEAGGVGEV